MQQRPVKRLETSAHGSRTTRGPCSGQSLRDRET